MNSLRQHLIRALENIASHENPDAPSLERVNQICRDYAERLYDAADVARKRERGEP
jgi:hypothetical protein